MESVRCVFSPRRNARVNRETRVNISSVNYANLCHAPFGECNALHSNLSEVRQSFNADAKKIIYI